MANAQTSAHSLPVTLGALRASGWQSIPVKEELRRNAVARISAGQQLFDGVLGYEDTVMPQLENALLAGHDVIFLGERGQAKTRMIRSLTGLLDEWMPIIEGSEINDDPYNPVSRHARELVEKMGDNAPISYFCPQLIRHFVFINLETAYRYRSSARGKCTAGDWNQE
jgi:magnesium chelatase subunit I